MEQTSRTLSYLSLLEDVAILETKLKNETGIEAVAKYFSFYQDRVHYQLRNKRAGVSDTLKARVAQSLFRKVKQAKTDDFDAAGLPSVSRLSHMALELGVFTASAWKKMVLLLVQHICAINTWRKHYDSTEHYERAMAKRDAHISDLIEAWRTLELQRHTAVVVGDAAEAAKRLSLPSPDRVQTGKRHNGDTHRAFAQLFCGQNMGNVFEAEHAAIATYVLLTDPAKARVGAPLAFEVKQFLAAVGQILAMAPPALDQIAKAYSSLERLGQYMCWRWPQVVSALQGKEDAGTTRPRFLRPTPGSINKQINNAIGSRSLADVNKAWAQFWGTDEHFDQEHVAWLASNQHVIHHFITAYTAMHQPAMAIAVWNAMEQVGIAATLKTWTSMMDGCRRSHDVQSIHKTWNKLMSTGVQLDAKIWTARIAALVEADKPLAGQRALAEMEHMWKMRQRPEQARVAVKPGIGAVNAVLAGFLRQSKVVEAEGLLVWASKNGIEADRYTFNTLLAFRVRRGETEEVQAVLDQMRESGLHPDQATYTIILEGVLEGAAAPGDPDRQIAVVGEILAQMDADGIRANQQTFGKMIYMLLKQGEARASETVPRLLSHIEKDRKMALSTYMLTIMVEYHFGQSPPDVAAVDRLVGERGLEHDPYIDRVFWERLVRGYCQAGRVDAAMRIFERKQNIFMTFSTLYDLLATLVAVGGREDDARKVVALALRIQEAAARAGGTNGARPKSVMGWRHRFWHVVDSYGLRTRV